MYINLYYSIVFLKYVKRKKQLKKPYFKIKETLTLILYIIKDKNNTKGEKE